MRQWSEAVNGDADMPLRAQRIPSRAKCREEVAVRRVGKAKRAHHASGSVIPGRCEASSYGAQLRT